MTIWGIVNDATEAEHRSGDSINSHPGTLRQWEGSSDYAKANWPERRPSQRSNLGLRGPESDTYRFVTVSRASHPTIKIRFFSDNQMKDFGVTQK
jgi:hypothetical protein